MKDDDDDEEDESRNPRFRTTQRHVIEGAAGSNDTHDPTARSKFCGRYWYPIYAYIRKSGHGEIEARDLTQDFFFKFIMERDILTTWDPDKGRLRDYLKAVVKNFLLDERERAKCAKRGGNTMITSFDAMAAEERYLCEPTDDLSPDRCYDRAWAISVLAEIMRILDQKYARLGGDHQACYVALRPLLDETKANSDEVEKVAAALGVTPAYVATRKFALRAEWRKSAHEVVKRTLHDASAEDASAELRLLVEFLQGNRQSGWHRK